MAFWLAACVPACLVQLASRSWRGLAGQEHVRGGSRQHHAPAPLPGLRRGRGPHDGGGEADDPDQQQLPEPRDHRGHVRHVREAPRLREGRAEARPLRADADEGPREP